MADRVRPWRLAVLAGGDALRQERLTRDLLDTLRGSSILSVGFVEAEETVEAGRKSAGLGDVALWAAAATAVARPGSQVLITLIKEWCAKERHRQVEVSYGGNAVTIKGRPDAAQEEMVREFLNKVANDGNAGAPDDARITGGAE